MAVLQGGVRGLLQRRGLQLRLSRREDGRSYPRYKPVLGVKRGKTM